MKKFIENLFGIDIFSYEEAFVTEDNILYNYVEFKFNSLKKYNGMSIELYINWDIKIWTENGEEVVKFNIIEVPEFKDILINIIKS